MESVINVFNISCWSFTTIVMSYNVFALWGLFPRSRRSKSKLREEALKNLADSDRTDFEKEMDRSAIERAKGNDYLHVYVRFIKDYKALDLNVLITRLRMGRSRLQTTMLPTRITSDQLVIWDKFNVIMKDFWIEGNGKDVMKKRNDVGRIAIYAMSHMDKADDLYRIVAQRGVSKLKDVKALLKDIDESPAGALSDGAL